MTFIGHPCDFIFPKLPWHVRTLLHCCKRRPSTRHSTEWDLVALGILRESDNSLGDNDGINVILAYLIEGLAFYVATVQQLLQIVLDVKISSSRLLMVAFNSISLSPMHTKSVVIDI